MITIDQQQKLFLNVARRLARKITVYAIGGTAMMFLGFKDATVDIDLVFENEKDRVVFKDAITSLGYLEINALRIYGVKRNTPEMFKLNDERFDLFVSEVIDFTFSPAMRTRANQIHQFADNLILKIANPQDLILMKCATDRIKDKDDAQRIITATKIDWEILIAEAKNQIALGKELAAFELGCFLEDIKTTQQIPVPQEVLDELFIIVEKQAKEKRAKR